MKAGRKTNSTAALIGSTGSVLEAIVVNSNTTTSTPRERSNGRNQIETHLVEVEAAEALIAVSKAGGVEATNLPEAQDQIHREILRGIGALLGPLEVHLEAGETVRIHRVQALLAQVPEGPLQTEAEEIVTKMRTKCASSI